jgi:hypothetical protein
LPSRSSTPSSLTTNPRAELVGELGRYQDSHRLCYVHNPEGIIVELAD